MLASEGRMSRRSAGEGNAHRKLQENFMTALIVIPNTPVEVEGSSRSTAETLGMAQQSGVFARFVLPDRETFVWVNPATVAYVMEKP
jgi:hypothetical protein